jgi:hypothetical protein
VLSNAIAHKEFWALPATGFRMTKHGFGIDGVREFASSFIAFRKIHENFYCIRDFARVSGRFLLKFRMLRC